MDDVEEAMASLGGPRVLPPQLRTALARQLLGEAPLLDGLDDPRRLPDDVRARLRTTLVAPPARRWFRRWLNVAAALLLVVAISTVALGTWSQSGRGHNGPSKLASPSGVVPVPSTQPGNPTAAPHPGSFGRDETKGAAANGFSVATGAPPPYAFRTPVPATGTLSQAARSSGGTAPAALRVGVVAGDQGEQLGFQAYLTLLNQQGGIRGRPLQAVPVSPSLPANGVVATVNLSADVVATPSGPPPWTAGPLLEGLAVPEAVLHGSVFDLASAPAHQAHLAVQAVFPNPAPGRTAVIYTETSGVLATDVPNALADALRRVQVTAVVLTYTPGQALPGGDAAFLSLTTADAAAWLAGAVRSGYRPPLGVTGFYSLAEPSVLTALPTGTRAMVPYDLPAGEERAALAQAVGGPPGEAAMHGWVTAKALAVALWQSAAMTPDGVQAALSRLAGYDDGFAPPFALRPGTTSRMPDAVLMTATNGTLVTTGGFRQDAG